MDRRKSIKTMMLGSIGAGLMLSSCVSKEEKTNPDQLSKQLKNDKTGYGRTPEEAARDAQLKSKTFFNDHEMATIAVLSDIIIPADKEFGAATDSGVLEFIEFIVKDIPSHQTPMRGGIRWLDYECSQLFGKNFIDCSQQQQLQIIDEIAHPGFIKPEYEQGGNFFNKIRNLVTTGYFTSKIGIEYLGYKGNRPNVWDGVPEEVLKKHGMEYEKEMLGKCMNPKTRNTPMDWEAYKKEHGLS